MQPIQISEPGAPHSSEDLVFGIDLGTTNSLIAIINEFGNLEIFKDEYGRELLPSIVSYEGDMPKVGCDMDTLVPQNTIHSVKRLMGKSICDAGENFNGFDLDHDSKHTLKIKCGDKKYTPVEVSAEILKALCRMVKKASGLEVKKAVVTVPAYFDNLARNATKHAAQLAGISVLRLVNEPTAAALAYSIEKNNNTGIYAIYDLGGGTFDISILKLHNGVFQVLAVGGDTNIGGNDFDYITSSIVLDKYNKKIQTSLNNLHCDAGIAKNFKGELFVKSRCIKEYLSDHAEGIFEFCINDKLFECKITRDELEQAAGALINKTINIVIRTIRDVDLKLDDISGVVLVGGSTRMPLIKESLFKLFGNKILDDVDPEKTVVTGAALQAHYLTSRSNYSHKILLDVLPLSLGIETVGGIVEKIISRNTPLPASEIKEFTTHADGQTAVKINVCQGEREMVKDNKSLAQFELKNIPPLPAGAAKIEVEFSADVNGILNITAREKSTGVEQMIDVNSSSELSKADIHYMINQSLENFDKDMEAKSLAESRIKCKKLIELIENNGEDLFARFPELVKAIQETKHSVQEHNLKNIIDATIKLENIITNNKVTC